MDALKLLTSSEPPQWLAPSSSLSAATREASSFLFSSLKPHAPKCPFDKLLVQGFDAEQIWQQIDIQAQPLLASLRQQVAYFQTNTREIEKFPGSMLGQKNEPKAEDNNDIGEDQKDSDSDSEDDLEKYDDDEAEEADEDEEEDEEETEKDGGIEDKFLKVTELEQYLEEDEAREYGLDTKKRDMVTKKRSEHDDSDSGNEEKSEEDEEEDELGEFDEDHEDDDANARYEDFFGTKKQKKSKKSNLSEEELDSDDEGITKENEVLSNHEQQLLKVQTEVEKMEKANLEPKAWTMQGEVTASKRPVNSALEVDLDFEHNIRPAPVITEEVSASLEDMIKTRIIEGRFDELEKVEKLKPKTPKDVQEIDDNKSKKGLGEVYEEEYVKKTNPFAAPVSFSDELKKEASLLFKKLCLQLDSLSHFHFAPKPVIEDMSIQSNVPALAIEEIAPIAVSDATMLAPEEVFEGKGDFKEETELTQSDRKRRRAQKKRRFKAKEASRVAKKTKHGDASNDAPLTGS